jgi:hypothetical protein
MDVDTGPPAELLEAWRDATRAAELAERLAAEALKAAENADGDAVETEEIATLAESAAGAAERAASSARAAATGAHEMARGPHNAELAEAGQAALAARAFEADSQDRSHTVDRTRSVLSDRSEGDPSGG